MRRPLVWIAGVLGLAALARALRIRRAAPPVAAEPDPADELRAAIATARAEEQETVRPDEAPSTLEERRRRVHERAQEAIDAMNDPPAGA